MNDDLDSLLGELPPPQLPSPDFVERVMAAEMAQREAQAGQARQAEQAKHAKQAKQAKQAKVVRLWAGAGVLAAVAAAALFVLWPRRPAEGEALATGERREVSFGRTVAVLEPGARIKWHGAEVEQLEGDVFYRVDKGGPYRVKTRAGEVDVLGTCFRVRIHGTPAAAARDTGEEDEGAMNTSIGKVGAGVLAGALMTVGVYEGRVRVSSAGQQHTLSAGESATLRGDGQRVGGDSSRKHQPEQAGDQAAPAPSEAEQAYAEANKSLVENIQALNRRMASIEDQKKQLQKQLDEAQVALARSGGEKGKSSRNEFDLTPDDWKQLAENGTVKYRTPCFKKSPWQPSADQLQSLGLSPDDGATLKEAYKKSNERMWGTIRPLCAAAVGGESLADKIGPDTCIHLVVDLSREKDGEAVSEAMRQVGEIRAGLRPMPADLAKEHPVVQLFTALTGEMKSFEGDLAQSLGPEEAHRIAYADNMCSGRSTFGGPGPRKK